MKKSAGDFFSSLRGGTTKQSFMLLSILVFLESKDWFFIGCYSSAFPPADRKPVKQANMP